MTGPKVNLKTLKRLKEEGKLDKVTDRIGDLKEEADILDVADDVLDILKVVFDDSDDDSDSDDTSDDDDSSDDFGGGDFGGGGSSSDW